MSSVQKESLLVIGTTAISTGIAIVPSDLVVGVVVFLMGVACLAIRGYFKLR